MKNAPLALVLGAVIASCGAVQTTYINGAKLPALDLNTLRAADLVCCLDHHGQPADNLCLQQEACVRMIRDRLVDANLDIQQCAEAKKMRKPPSNVLQVGESANCIINIDLRKNGEAARMQQMICAQAIHAQAECLRHKINAAGIRCTRIDMCNLIEGLQ